MKTVIVKPVEEIEIIFLDEKKIRLLFNMDAIRYFQEELEKIDKKYEDVTTSEMCGMIIYAGAKADDQDLTIEEAKTLAKMLDVNSSNGIINDFINEIREGMTEEEKELQKKMMAQFLQKKGFFSRISKK